MDTALIIILIVLVLISIASLITNVIIIKDRNKADKEQQANPSMDYQALFGPINQSIGKMESEIGKLSSDLSSVIRESSYKNNSDLLSYHKTKKIDNDLLG